MIPKTEIRFSWIYNYLANDNNFTLEDLDSLKKEAEEFVRIYNVKIRKALRLIKKYSGWNWKVNFIPIYILKTEKPSFSDPLTLKFPKKTRDPEGQMVVLIHELVHNIIPVEKQLSVDLSRDEQFVNLVTRFVSLDLGLDISKAHIGDFDGALALGYDLKKKSLREYVP